MFPLCGRGTPGCLDSEYFLTRNLTDKSDVYSLGVVFLELLNGSTPIFHGVMYGAFDEDVVTVYSFRLRQWPILQVLVPCNSGLKVL